MKISVCLATYNGEKYIKEQLDSILPQLSANDEIIISDDNSTDDTINIIRSLNDERIKIYVNKTKGIVKNFENALNNASGDIIFLSDQDDVWKNDKVKKILSAFSSDNSLTLVFSNAEIIDENGISKNYNFFKDNEANYTSIFKAFFKNQFLACQISLVMGFLPALLLSGLMFPISSMPAFFRYLTAVLPQRYFVSFIESEFLAGTISDIVLINTVYLSCLCLVLLFLVYKNTLVRLEK